LLLTGITPIELKAEETANLYRITRDKQNHQLDHEVEPKDWTHPADSVKINEQTEGNEHKSKYSQMEARMNMV
jgi:hypothetical protein